MKYSLIIISAILSFSILLNAQIDTTNLIRYDYSFSFNEGIYLNFDSFKSNNPIPFESLISPAYTENGFYDKFDSIEFISYSGNYGNTVTIPLQDIWGYCKKGKPYIYWADKFNLVPYVGSITHFITTIKVYYSGYHDPYYDPYGHNPTSRTYQSDELRQYIIDMETGKIMDYNLSNIEILLKRDPEVYNDFMELRKRKRSKQMFYYVGIYNEKNPLYLPK